MNDLTSHPKAIELWRSGKAFRCSTNINNEPSYGYGNLDDYGFFDYELSPEFITDEVSKENKRRWNKIRNNE